MLSRCAQAQQSEFFTGASTHSCSGQHQACRSKGLHQALPCEWQGLEHLAYFQFPQAVIKKLDQKWSSLDTRRSAILDTVVAGVCLAHYATMTPTRSSWVKVLISKMKWRLKKGQCYYFSTFLRTIWTSLEIMDLAMQLPRLQDPVPLNACFLELQIELVTLWDQAKLIVTGPYWPGS